MISKKKFDIELEFKTEDLSLTISSKRENTLYFQLATQENNESQYQLIEGCSYDYEFSNESYHFEKNQIVRPHSLKNNMGIISTNTFVGTLVFPIYKNNIKVGRIEFEVQSIKSSYREDYREMLAYIAEKSTDLIMASSSPSVQYIEVDYEGETETLYQKFQFIKSIIDTEDFGQAVNKIIDSPITKMTETKESIDTRRARKLTSSNIREFISSSARIEIPEDHVLNDFNITSLPQRVSYNQKKSIVDTPENQFVKHTLEEYLDFCSDINYRSKEYSLLFKESLVVIKKLETFLTDSFFREISDPRALNFNSPSLQRRDGYRELFQSWLMFDLASKLTWTGGDDVYSAGKRNVATLYEYWLFFVILDVLQEIIDIDLDDIYNLIEPTKAGLNLKLKQGNLTNVLGRYTKDKKTINVKFTYNRTFSGSKKPNESGSWSLMMRPDYTISFWPYNLSEGQAEESKTINHLHFDAKYKISNWGELIDENSSDNQENYDSETNDFQGQYKNEDLLKMHAYKDAIRGTIGSYVLYPGDKSIQFKEHNSSSKGIGAYPVKPSKINNGIDELKQFILDCMSESIKGLRR